MPRKLISRVVTTIAGLTAPVAIGAALLLLGSGWPASQAEAATQHTCSGSICIDVQELPDTAPAFGQPFNRAVKFSVVTGEYGGHYNVRTRDGNQVDICGQCAWTFYANPGKSYTFSVQGCGGGSGPGNLFAGSTCGSWNTFHYKAVPILQVIIAPPPAEPTGPVKALGRVKLPPGTARAPPMPVCDAARMARARNNAAAPGLEAQCQAALAQQQAALAQQVEALPDNGQSADAHILANNAGGQGADLTVVSIKGPGSLQAGLSGTFKITIQNVGTASVTVELAILFAKALDETGQVVPNANGLACASVGTGGPINAQLNCTGGQLAAGETGTVIVQGRGQAAGAGMLIANLNNSRSVQESNYNNNVRQLGVAIN